MVRLLQERASRVLATLLTLMLLASPLMPPAGGQPLATALPPNTSAELSVSQGDIAISQGTGRTPFVTNGTIQVEVTIRNSGTSNASNLPVYAYFLENTSAYGCGLTGIIPARDGARLIPGEGKSIVNVPVPIDSSFDSEGNRVDWRNIYTLKVIVNRLPAVANEKSWQRCAQVVTGAANDPNTANNVAFAEIIKDLRPDLEVSSVLWCKGAAPVPGSPVSACDEEMLEGGGAYNITRKWGETTTAANGTYFRFTVSNGGTLSDAKFNHYRGDADCDITFTATPPATVEEIVLGPEATCGGHRYNHDVRWAHEGQSAKTSSARLTNNGFATNGTGTWNSTTFSLLNKSGRYNLSIVLNKPVDGLPDNFEWPIIPEAARERTDGEGVTTTTLLPNEHDRRFEVAWSDLRVNVTNADHTTLADPYPYPANSLFDVVVDVQFFNDGPAPPTVWAADGTRSSRPVFWRAYINNMTSPENVIWHDGNTEAGHAPPKTGLGNQSWLAIPENAWKERIVLKRSSNPTDFRYIPPGQHTVFIEVNYNNGTAELNATRNLTEGNNKAAVDIFIQNSGAPTFVPLFGQAKPRITGNDSLWTDSPIGTSTSPIRPRDLFAVNVNVTDADQAKLRVSYEFTLTSDPTVNRTYDPCPANAPVEVTGCVRLVDTPRYALRVQDFVFATNNTTETWSIRANATSSSLKSVLSAPTTFTLKRWPIQTAPEDYIIYGIRNESNAPAPLFLNGTPVFAYEDNLPIRYWLFVDSNMTGFVGADAEDQPNRTANLGLRVEFPADAYGNHTVRFFNGTINYTNLSSCTTVTSPIPPREVVTCNSERGNFTSTNLGALKDRGGPGTPGIWNVTIYVTDLGGDVRAINRSFILKDLAPQVSQPLLSSNDIVPGSPLNVKVNVSDDFDVKHTYLNLTRTTDGYNASYLLTHNGSSPALDNRINYSYNHTFETGHGKTLGVGGKFKLTVASVDPYGNWANSTEIELTLNDTEAPKLLAAGVDLSLQEVGQNVTFHANATDATNITARLQIIGPGSAIGTDVNMTEETLGNFTHTLSLPEGTYTWQIFMEDSVGQQSNVKQGPLSVKPNFGPRFRILEPSTFIDGQRYGRAAPHISLVVEDANGVSRDSIVLSLDGINVTPDDVTEAQGGKSFTVNYTVPSSQKYDHLAVIKVNATAIDLSDAQLASPQQDFTILVDDSAPTARMPEFTPSFRASEANRHNVSLETRFAIVGDDNDGLPTGVSFIKYSVVGLVVAPGSTRAETVYSGPFRFSDPALKNVYRGPLPYLIQYWAVDDVGNQGKVDQQLVFVDDIPPSLDPFGSLPQGRFVNATLIDENAGVDRAVVWISTNNDPYTPIPLDFTGGLWTTVLPEGKRGDKVSYYLQAWDRVENTDLFGNSTVPYLSYVVGDHVPSIRITSPAEGSKLENLVDITWIASDEDNDPLTFTVYYRAPGKTAFVELAKLDRSDTRKYSLDTSTLKDGLYTFRVTVNSGSFADSSETTVTIHNVASAIGPIAPLPAEVDPGDLVLFKIEITKAQASVELRIYRDGDFVQSYAMNDEGREGDLTPNDGVYSVQVPMDTAGDYSVKFFTRYQEDGQLKDDSADGPAFTVRLTPAYILSHFAAVLAIIGLLAVGGIGVAAYAIMRRR